MTGNPKTSPWYNQKRDKRRRRCLELTLSDQTRVALAKIAAATGRSRSRVVDDLVLAALQLLEPAEP